MLLKSLRRFVCSVTAEECLERYCTQEDKNSLTWRVVVMVAGWEVCGGEQLQSHSCLFVR